MNQIFRAIEIGRIPSYLLSIVSFNLKSNPIKVHFKSKELYPIFTWNEGSKGRKK